MSVFLIKNPAFVFIHIPKTGGSSIRHGLFHSDYEGPVMGHIPVEWMSMIKVAFVRNPYDRVVSAWKMFSSMHGSALGCGDCSREDSFNRFLDVVVDEDIPYDFGGVDKVTVNMKIRHHTIPITHAYNCIECADFIGRFENFHSDVNRMLKIVGVPPPDHLPFLNRSRHKPYAAYYDGEAHERVSAFYREDCERFGYQFYP